MPADYLVSRPDWPPRPPDFGSTMNEKNMYGLGAKLRLVCVKRQFYFKKIKEHG